MPKLLNESRSPGEDQRSFSLLPSALQGKAKMPVRVHVTPLVRKAWTVTLNLSLVIYTMGTAPFVESLPGIALTQVAHPVISALGM